MKCVETASFSILSGRFVRMLMMRHIGRMWWVYALPVVACLGLAFADIRFLLIALMLVFVILPPLLFFVYFNYGLDPLNRYNVMEKTLVADEAGLSMLIDEKYGLKNNVVRLSWDDVAGREVQAGCVVIYVHKYRGNRFVAVPLSAFPSEQVLRDFIALFDAVNAVASTARE